ncbi:hypothetical protein HDV00_003390 [Rhizophlyctis rosea]|nr:hypothetical protein HDV00_003390 [Rhizophlyctis rosea]
MPSSSSKKRAPESEGEEEDFEETDDVETEHQEQGRSSTKKPRLDEGDDEESSNEGYIATPYPTTYYVYLNEETFNEVDGFPAHYVDAAASLLEQIAETRKIDYTTIKEVYDELDTTDDSTDKDARMVQRYLIRARALSVKVLPGEESEEQFDNLDEEAAGHMDQWMEIVLGKEEEDDGLNVPISCDPGEMWEEGDGEDPDAQEAYKYLIRVVGQAPEHAAIFSKFF